MVDVSHEPALCYHQRNVAYNPGTYPSWHNYPLGSVGRLHNNVSTLPGIGGPQTVNHSVEFVAANGTHTQHIESYWNRVKGKLKRMKGCHARLVTWMSLCGENATATKRVWPMWNIMRDIANQYPVELSDIIYSVAVTILGIPILNSYNHFPFITQGFTHRHFIIPATDKGVTNALVDLLLV